MHDRREGAMKYERPALHRTIFAVDVEGYGDQRRTTPHRLALRRGLYRALCRAFDDAGVPWADCRREDCGDGVFVLAPPEVPKGLFVEFLPAALAVALHRHNRTHDPGARIRLRMALHAGEIAYDDHGVTAPAINQTFRLLEAAPLKEALKTSRGVLALITSAWFFDEVVRHSDGLDPTTFRPVPVAVKETRTTGWISLPDRPYPANASLLGGVTPIDHYRTWRRFRRHAQVLADREP
jgi:class 3 adenylate cyclase